MKTDGWGFRKSVAKEVPAAEDSLGFKPYVSAVGDFLLARDTTPPFTMSIEGEWGCGKSSFMLQLRDYLRAACMPTPYAWQERLKRFPFLKRLSELRFKPQLTPDFAPLVTIEFNAWRHEKQDAIWAALALECLKQIPPQLGLYRRLLCVPQLVASRLRSLGLMRFTLMIALYVLVFFAIGTMVSLVIFQRKELTELAKAEIASTQPASQPPGRGFNWNQFLGNVGKISGYGSVPVLLAAGTLLCRAPKSAVAAITKDFRSRLQGVDYASQTPFIEKFSDDFSVILDAYVGPVRPEEEGANAKIFVFIDDLDRCAVPTSADIMQAINLMISGDGRLVFILGLDRAKVAAGIAVKYEKILPFLKEATISASPDDRRETGLSYAYEFLEKFIQLSFRIPSPGTDQIQAFMRKFNEQSKVRARTVATATTSQSAVALATGAQVVVSPPAKAQPTQKPPAPNPAPPTTPAEAQARLEQMQMMLDNDSDNTQQIVGAISPYLKNNPRRLIHFLNLFRLQAFIAFQTALLDLNPTQTAITLPQLGKVVAISIRWPGFMLDLIANPSLLNQLQRVAIGETTVANSPQLTIWSARTDLLDLLRFRAILSDITTYDAAFDLRDVNARRLLVISPAVPRQQAPPPTPAHQPTTDLIANTAATPSSTAAAFASSVQGEGIPLNPGLLSLGQEYEKVRREMNPGDDRTDRMTEITQRIATMLAPGSLNQVEDFFHHSSGGRIIALVLIRQNRLIAHALMAIRAIATAESPFEQYIALAFMDENFKDLDEPSRNALESTLKERFRSATGVAISESDPSRFILYRRIVDKLQNHDTVALQQGGISETTLEAQTKRPPRRKKTTKKK